MKKILFCVFCLISFSSFAAEPLFRPIGTYRYSNEVQLMKMRTAETVNFLSEIGLKRMKELKTNGFSCIRKNSKESLCQKIESQFDETPDFIKNSVSKFLKSFLFTFQGTGPSVLIHDGADTEWMITEEVYIGTKKISNFKITKTFENKWFLSFPVSANQGIGNAELYSIDQLGLSLILQTKNNNQTIGYFVTAKFSQD